LPKFDALFQYFMEKKENLVFMIDPLDGSNKYLRNVHFYLVLSTFEEKNMTSSAHSVTVRLHYLAESVLGVVRLYCALRKENKNKPR
jgi:fructose-1,6-bisphosphatase/inositol monophosphatase family enzyme